MTSRKINLPRYEINDIEHPGLEPFREIRSRNWTEQSGLFIAEGPLLVERLLTSNYTVKSILLDKKYQPRYEPMIADDVELLLVDHAFVEQVVGFNFHRGALACGLRRASLSVRTDFAELPDASSKHRETIVCAAGVQDPENLGGILRSCAALGIERVIIGPGTADPLSRRVLRVSMGTALRLQLFRSRNLIDDIHWLQSERQISSVATTLSSDSEPLEQASRDGATLILVGNERYGLPAELQAAATRRIRIGMDLGTDSLNVCVAAGIVMHYFCRIA